MSYVFDTNAFSQLFHSYYRNRFPTLWEQFDELIENGDITSTREVSREIEGDRVATLRDWAAVQRDLFPTPNAVEAGFVGQIFAVPHFLQIIERKKLLKGGLNADPFIIARAHAIEGTVVTLEGEPPNGAKIPNICRHFGIPCVSLEGFMEAEDWTF
ncbi:PIN domain-containing protein [uncultured Tateyamaria sp.]|uniref:PIN domain-containing protein n=1 Tax=uncultured Tateyamaria sp. TaxID=455651 RepID=UPI0026180415|nr:PIN domain-containing protein [uncultured Tateyamaria sp.]